MKNSQYKSSHDAHAHTLVMHRGVATIEATEAAASVNEALLCKTLGACSCLNTCSNAHIEVLATS